jgi:hypothetical protein
MIDPRRTAAVVGSTFAGTVDIEIGGRWTA